MLLVFRILYLSFCMWNTYVFIDYCICCNDLGIRPQNAKVKLWPFGFIVVVSSCFIVFSC